MSAALAVALLGIGLLVASFVAFLLSSRSPTWDRIGQAFAVVGLACIATGVLIAAAVIASALFHL